MHILARNWGWVALRGLAALPFGLVTLYRPGMTLRAFLLLFAMLAIADGAFTVVSAVVNRRGEPWWPSLLIGGIAGIAVGALTLAAPQTAALAPLYFIGAWAIVTGLAGIVAAARLRQILAGEWLLALTGVLAVLFGLTLVLFPQIGALTVMIWIGAYATVAGVLLLALAFRLKSRARGRIAGEVPPTA